MTTHVYKRGETIISIAREHRFRAWRPIWEHAGNASLRAQRADPNQLVDGDAVFIPDRMMAEQPCVTNQRHVFRLRPLTQHVQQRLLDENGQPMAGLQYSLTCAGETFRGRTDAEGELVEEVAAAALEATLTITLPGAEPMTWSLQFGHLEPVDTVYGVKARLTHLGYECGTVDDNFDEATRDALRAFQADAELPVSGERDAATIAQLATRHDRSLKG
jgi:peptidoglycan hydrolase-like protein with peptidoglycan-binding domain